jgi:hypothetical protein
MSAIGPDEVKVSDECKAWEHNRKLYPGWLIAPPQNRDRVWLTTVGWVNKIQQQLPKMDLPDQIIVLRELNWRLERCLIPIWRELAVQMEQTLNAVNPFPRVLTNNAPLTQHPDNLKKLNWPNIQAAWAELSHALLRFYRENLNRQEFDRCLARTKQLEPEFPILHSKLMYQRCLYAVSEMDYRTARAILGEWQSSEADPFDLVRRASIYGEIGDLDRAAELANEGLSQIRYRTRTEIDDFTMLSREGWAMLLLRTIRNATENGEHDEYDFRGRWEKLAEYRCNPNHDIELFRARLDQPRPSPPEHIVKTSEFDPGKVSRTLSFGPTLWQRLLPARQVVRMIEDAALPPRCGNWLLSMDLMRKSAEWQADYDLKAATAICLRLTDLKTVQNILTRLRVARLSGEDLHYMFELAATTIQANLHASALASPERGMSAEDRIAVAFELLSRLAIRVDDDTLDKMLAIAIAAYKSQQVRTSRKLAEALAKLFDRVLELMKPARLMLSLKAIFSLPILGAGEVDPSFQQDFPEPVISLPGDLRNFSPKREEDNLAWTSIIRNLLGTAEADLGSERERAIIRLAALYEYRMMTPEEVRAFADALWKYRDGVTGLPRLRAFRNFVFLSLPEPDAGTARRILHDYYLERKITPLRTRTVGSDGKTSETFGMFVDSGEDIRGILAASMAVPPTRPGDERLINWTKNEAAQLFEKINEWWIFEGKELAESKDKVFVGEQVEDRLRVIADLIRNVILPRCEPGDALTSAVRAFTKDITAHSTSAALILPYLVRFFPEDRDDIAKYLERAVVSANKAEAEYAIAAVWLWSVRKDSDADSVPQSLVHELGQIIRDRRVPALGDALRFGAKIIADAPERIDAEFIETSLIGLDFLLEETSYRDPASAAPVPDSAIPEFRSHAAQFARALADSGRTNEPIVQQWLAIIESDPLPEVRNARGTIT